MKVPPLATGSNQPISALNGRTSSGGYTAREGTAIKVGTSGFASARGAGEDWNPSNRDFNPPLGECGNVLFLPDPQSKTGLSLVFRTSPVVQKFEIGAKRLSLVSGHGPVERTLTMPEPILRMSAFVHKMQEEGIFKNRFTTPSSAPQMLSTALGAQRNVDLKKAEPKAPMAAQAASNPGSQYYYSVPIGRTLKAKYFGGVPVIDNYIAGEEKKPDHSREEEQFYHSVMRESQKAKHEAAVVHGAARAAVTPHSSEEVAFYERVRSESDDWVGTKVKTKKRRSRNRSSRGSVGKKPEETSSAASQPQDAFARWGSWWAKQTDINKQFYENQKGAWEKKASEVNKSLRTADINRQFYENQTGVDKTGENRRRKPNITKWFRRPSANRASEANRAAWFSPQKVEVNKAAWSNPQTAWSNPQTAWSNPQTVGVGRPVNAGIKFLRPPGIKYGGNEWQEDQPYYYWGKPQRKSRRRRSRKSQQNNAEPVSY